MNVDNPQLNANKEENKEGEKKEDEFFTNDDEKNLYLDLIDLKDYIPEILLIPAKKINKTQMKTELLEDNDSEQQPQMKVLNNNQENSQNIPESIF